MKCNGIPLLSISIISDVKLFLSVAKRIRCFSEVVAVSSSRVTIRSGVDSALKSAGENTSKERRQRIIRVLEDIFSRM